MVYKVTRSRSPSLEKLAILPSREITSEDWRQSDPLLFFFGVAGEIGMDLGQVIGLSKVFGKRVAEASNKRRPLRWSTIHHAKRTLGWKTNA